MCTLKQVCFFFFFFSSRRRHTRFDCDWSSDVCSSDLDHIGSASRDLFQLHTLQPHQSRSFTGWLQVGSSGDLAPVVRAEIERRRLPSGTVRGAVGSRDGKALGQPVAVAERDGKPYAWVVGHGGGYHLRLPAGEYALYATGRDYSRSAPASVNVRDGTGQVRDFHDLDSPGRLAFSVTDARNGAALDARIVITEGYQPLVGLLGGKTFFTQLGRKGHADLPIAPGRYLFTVSSGGGFLAADSQVRLAVAAGPARQHRVAITPLFDPPSRGWYCADLHHHADQAEAVTPPADLARSQLAAGAHLLFCSDHDFTPEPPGFWQNSGAPGGAVLPAVRPAPHP